MSNSNNAAVCSFCGTSAADTSTLIAGRDGAYICSDCVQLSYEIVGASNAEPLASLPDHTQSTDERLGALFGLASVATRNLEQQTELARRLHLDGVSWDAIAKSLGISAADAETKFGS